MVTDFEIPDTPIELPTLPAGWKYELLGNLVEERGICYGVVQPGQETANGVPIVRVNNLRDGRIDSADVMRIDTEIESKYRRSRLTGDEVLLSLVGTLGQVAVVPGTMSGWNVARAVGVIPVRNNPGSQWVALCLRSGFLQHCIRTWASTSVQATLNLREVSKLPIPIPPKETREAIARILGTLDDKIELNRRMNATLEAMARALFQNWLETNESETEEQRVQSLIDSRTLLIGDGYRAKNSEMSAGGLPFVRAGNLRGDGLDLSGAETLGAEGVKAAGHKLGQAGDVAFTSKGTVGRITRVSPKTGQFVYSPQVCFWRSLAPDKLHPNVLYRWMCTTEFMRQVDAVSRQTDMAPYVSLQDQRKMTINLPPSQVQLEIAKQLQPIDDKIAANAEQSRTLATLRDTLLPKLLSGEVEVAN